MNTLLFWGGMDISAAVAAIALIALARRGRMLPWDFGLVVAPGIVWFALTIAALLPKSLSNFVELFALAPITAGLLGLRWWLSEKWAPAIFGCGVLAALLLYALVPALPE